KSHGAGAGEFWSCHLSPCHLRSPSGDCRYHLPAMPYNFTAIEKTWQAYWLTNKTFAAIEPKEAGPMPKAYVLDMFPYPSGAGLHVRHPAGYTATDTVSRNLRRRGSTLP